VKEKHQKTGREPITIKKKEKKNTKIRKTERKTTGAELDTSQEPVEVGWPSKKRDRRRDSMNERPHEKEVEWTINRRVKLTRETIVGGWPRGSRKNLGIGQPEKKRVREEKRIRWRTGNRRGGNWNSEEEKN